MTASAQDSRSPGPVAVTSKLYIGGSWTDGTATETVEVINPATERAIGSVPQASVEDVISAVQAARTAFDEGPWPRFTPAQRAVTMSRMGEIMAQRFDELVELNIAEAGTTRMLADFLQVRTPFEHWLDMAHNVLPQYRFDEPMLPMVAPGVGIGQGIITREPIGVAALITPFNFPFFLNVFKLAPALAAGATMVLKPSPLTPYEAIILGEIAEEAELPAGVLNIVTGDIAASEALTRHPMVDMVSFTGSDAVGRKVYGQAAETLKKVVLELGGKSANIICADADLDAVVKDVVANMTIHCGQGCALLTRTLVHQDLHDELISRLKMALEHIVVGDPADPSTTMGPLISAAQRTHVERLIQVGIDEGAQLAHGGGRGGLNTGFFVEPTLFVGVDNTMTIARREVFGPVGVVIPFRDDDHAVTIANDSDYGLGGGVWSGDPTRALGIARRIRTGIVSINGGAPGINPHAAFGGYKQSGLGREWGAWGLSEFLQHKTIHWSAR